MLQLHPRVDFSLKLKTTLYPHIIVLYKNSSNLNGFNQVEEMPRPKHILMMQAFSDTSTCICLKRQNSS